MKVNGKEYRIAWLPNQAKVYEYSTDHEGYLFWGNVFAETLFGKTADADS